MPRKLDGMKMAKKLAERASAGGTEWLENTTAAIPDMIAGAKRSEAKWKSGVERAATKKRYSAGVGKIDASQTAATIAAVGSGAVAAGLAARQGKVEAAFLRLAPLIDAASDKTRSLPGDTPEQRKARMVQHFDNMSAVGDQFRQ